MKAEKKLIKYLLKRKKNITGLLNKPAKSYTAFHFHKLRVEVKKMNALFTMLNATVKKFHRKKSSRPFDAIYDQAGKIREIQLEQEMLKKTAPAHPVPNYQALLKKEKRKERLGFTLMKNKDLAARVKKIYPSVEAAASEVSDDDIQQYLKKQRKEIQALLQEKKLKSNQTHDIRKMLKSWYYNLKSLQLDEDKALFDKLNRFQDLLGTWHDYRVLDDKLQKTTRSKKLNGMEIKNLALAKTKISAQADSLFHKIEQAKGKLNLGKISL